MNHTIAMFCGFVARLLVVLTVSSLVACATSDSDDRQRIEFEAVPDAEHIPVERLVQHVDVRRVDLDFAGGNRKDVEILLEDIFTGNQHSQAFSRLAGDDRVGMCGEYSAKLVELAAEKALPASDLRACLDRIHRGTPNPSVPVAAYLATDQGDDVWIVVGKYGPRDPEGNPRLIHADVHAIRVKDLFRLGWCLY